MTAYGDPSCFLCDGVGGWTDHVDQQSKLCPICHPVAAAAQDEVPLEAPALQRLQMPWLPSFWGHDHQRFCAPFLHLPDLLVIHSASSANWVGEYLNNPVAETPKPHEIDQRDPTRASGGRRLVDGVWYRVAAAHVSYYEGRARKLRAGTKAPQRAGCFAQQADLGLAVPGAGGSRCQGRGGVNPRSWHIELPANPDNPAEVREQFRPVVRQLVELGSLRFWTEHKIIDPANRGDPVLSSGFSSQWMAGLGLQLAGR